jgi:curli biogenesis system outer membrane secretion channel CsgG
MFTSSRRIFTAALLASCGGMLAGCADTYGPLGLRMETKEIVGPSPHANLTPMAEAMACLRREAPTPNVRLGVSEFVDGTGSIEGLAMNSRVFSQRPDYMMIVGLKSAGVNLVNRSSVNVAEWEMKQAMEQKLGDGHKVSVGDGSSVLFRPVKAGAILGSTHYLTGAITELNWNIDSKVAEANILGVNAGGRTYRVSLAVDVMVTDTQSTEVVHARSYKKQLVGFETDAGYFRFIEKNSLNAMGWQGAVLNKGLDLFQANLGDKQNEPNQTALRWVIELAAYDTIRSLTKRGAACDSLLPPGSLDPTIPGGGVGPDVVAFPDPAIAPGGRGRYRRADAQGAGAAQPTAVAATAPAKPVTGAPSSQQASAQPVASMTPGVDPERTVPPEVRNSWESRVATKARENGADPSRSKADAATDNAATPAATDAKTGGTASAPRKTQARLASASAQGFETPALETATGTSVAR